MPILLQQLKQIKIMRTRLTFIALAIVIFSSGNAQIINPKEIIKRKAQDRANQTTNNTIDQGLDKIEEGIGSIFKKKEKSTKTQSGNSTQTKSQGNNSPTRSNSKFDFEPGQKQLGFDDFSTTNVGDFPLGWNTNSSAEIVTLNDSNQKWLSMTKDGFFLPEFIKDLPENCTIEFDVFTRYVSNNILNYSFYINAVESPKKDLDNKYIKNGIYFTWQPVVGFAKYFVLENGEEVSKNEGLKVNGFITKNEKNPIIARVSIWRQKSRLRVYVNEDKILDLPQAFDPKQKYNSFKFGAEYMNYSNGREQDDEFMVANVRYAVAGEDTRSKLITEGKFVTNEILFDVNSDQIKAESNKIITEIGNLLVENSTVKIKIIGHTDSDGDASANLTLSKKRAEAVKMRLVYGFGISESRLSTDGKGETAPLINNSTSEAKAQNRRVEFIKL